MAALDQLSELWGVISPVLNSNFMVALTGGAIGAFGGAMGAQRITERGIRRRELLTELKQTNKAILLTSQICNSALALKKQFALPLFTDLQQAQADFEYIRSRPLMPGDQPYLQFNFVKFPAPIFPLDLLEQLVFKDLGAVNRELSAVSEIGRASDGLRDTLARREAFIDKVQSKGFDPSIQHHVYLGLPQPNGQTDGTHPDLVQAILEYTDDLAYFSYALSQDLSEHGQGVVKALSKYTRRAEMPTLRSVDFSGPLNSGLLASDEKYGSWTAQFVRAADIVNETDN